MMITVFLFSFSWQWTDQFYTQICFTSDINKIYLMPDVFKTAPPALSAAIDAVPGYATVIRNTAGMMIIMPLVIVYLFCQRYLVQGIERSGLVG